MRLLASLALGLALAGCVSMDTYRKKAAEASRFRQEWEDELAARAVLQEKIASMQQQVDSLTGDLTGIREKMQVLADELAASRKKVEAAKAELEKELEKKTGELEKKSGEYDQLASALRGEIEAGRIELMELRGRATVRMKDKILFASGSASIGPGGRVALRKVAHALREVQSKAVRVEGHTDNIPTGARRKFPSNWELSSARALAVVRFLQQSGVDPSRLSAAGFGQYQPIQSNDTPEGRGLNRRIEITLLPMEGALPSARPAPTAAPAPAALPAPVTKGANKKT